MPLLLRAHATSHNIYHNMRAITATLSYCLLIALFVAVFIDAATPRRHFSLRRYDVTTYYCLFCRLFRT